MREGLAESRASRAGVGSRIGHRDRVDRHGERDRTARTTRRAVAHCQRRVVGGCRRPARHCQGDRAGRQRRVRRIRKAGGIGRAVVINAVLIRAAGGCGVRQARTGRALTYRRTRAQRYGRCGIDRECGCCQHTAV